MYDKELELYEDEEHLAIEEHIESFLASFNMHVMRWVMMEFMWMYMSLNRMKNGIFIHW